MSYRNPLHPLDDRTCAHRWVAGICYVSDDDLLAVAEEGRKVECEACEVIFDPKNPAHLPEWMR